MQAKGIFLMAFSAVMLLGCRKSFEKVEDVNFDAYLSANTFKVGEKVTFGMTGNPDFITFYSGEVGREYSFSNKDRVVETQMSFSFTTTTNSGTPGFPNPNKVPVAWSSDFSGEYTEEAVRKATWNDITGNFNMPDDIGASNMFSGELLISPFYEDFDKPIYFMFHYVVDAFDESVADGRGNGRTQWSFASVSFKGITGDSAEELYDIVSAGWKIVASSSYEDQVMRSDINASRLLLRSDFRPAHDVECWAVSGPIYKMDYINNGPDRGVGIKSVSDPDMSRYTYTWNEPGEYVVTFVAANANVYDRKKTVKEFKIRVIEDGGSIVPPLSGDWN